MKQHNLKVEVSFKILLCNHEGMKPRIRDIIAYLKDCIDDGSINDLLEEIEVINVEDLGDSKIQF